VDTERGGFVAGPVASKRQARLATKAYLKKHLDLPLTNAEETHHALVAPATEMSEAGR
jgi:hypothetical protein